MKYNRGEITPIVAIIGASATILVGALTSYATSNTRVGQIETKVEVLQERQNLQYVEVKNALSRIEDKIDKVIR